MYVLMWFVGLQHKTNKRVTPHIDAELCHENILRIRQVDDRIGKHSIIGENNRVFLFDDLAMFNNFECAYACMCELDELDDKEFDNAEEIQKTISEMIKNNKEKFNDK